MKSIVQYRYMSVGQNSTMILLMGIIMNLVKGGGLRNLQILKILNLPHLIHYKRSKLGVLEHQQFDTLRIEI